MRRNEIAGINIGKFQEPKKGALRELKEQGIVVHPNTISQIRGGFMTGGQVEYQLRCALVRGQNDSTLKDVFYRKITSTGVQIIEEEGPQKDLSATRIKSGDIRRSLMAMRVDLACYASSKEDLPEDINRLFREQTEIFIKHKSRRGSKPVERLDKLWESRTLVDFYRTMYSLNATAMIGSWVPYELPVLDQFYLHQENMCHNLTPLDYEALDSGISPMTRRLTQILRGTWASKLRGETGIAMALAVLTNHRNTLLYGSPTNPAWKHQEENI
jgi:hypothetical protein